MRPRGIVALAVGAGLIGVGVFLNLEDRTGVVPTTSEQPPVSDNTALFRPGSVLNASSATMKPSTKLPSDTDGGRLDFWNSTSKQLFNIYERGMLGSATSVDKFFALQAVELCLPVIMNFQPRENLDLDGSTIQSIRETRMKWDKKCEEFFRVKSQDLISARQLLNNQLDDPSSSVKFLDINLNAESDRAKIDVARESLRSAVENFGVDSMYWTSPALTSWLQFVYTDSQYSNIPITRIGSAETLQKAMMLAMCMSGYPCGKGTIVYINLCVGAAICGEALEQGILASISSKELRDQTLGQAREISRAILSKDYAALGL